VFLTTFGINESMGFKHLFKAKIELVFQQNEEGPTSKQYSKIIPSHLKGNLF
jgi:hypothetical protein